MPDTSPTVSMAETKAIRQKPTMAATLNSNPYLKGWGRAKAAERFHDEVMASTVRMPTPNA